MGMRAKSYRRRCKNCGRVIQLRPMPHGGWVAFEGYATVHDCTKPPPPRTTLAAAKQRAHEPVTFEDIGFKDIEVRGKSVSGQRIPGQSVARPSISPASAEEFQIIICPNPRCRQKNRVRLAFLSRAVCGKCETPLAKAHLTTTGSSVVRAAIRRGINERRVVRILYNSRDRETTTREIEPLSEDGKLCYAYCRLRRDFRSFRFSRIKAAEVLDETFTPRSPVPSSTPSSRPAYRSAEIKRLIIPSWVWWAAAIVFLLWVLAR